MTQSDYGLFMGQVLRRPHEVVALAPSSSALCAEMVAELEPDGGPVIELGAGTGTITQMILARGIAPSDLHCIEMNPDFCDRLRIRFPGVQIHQIRAEACGGLPVNDVQAVISGLPLLSMPMAVQSAIVAGACEKLAHGRDYVQFTYGPTAPVARAVRQELALTGRRSARIWWNLPPARVYRFRKGGT